MKRIVERKIPPQYLGIAALNPTAPEDSSARQEMYGSHLSQTPPPFGCTTRRMQGGLEREFGHGTFSVKFPAVAEIEAVIDRYPQSQGSNIVSPMTAVIYTNKETNELDVLEIPSHHCLHNHFGFRYQKTKEIMRLRRGSVFRKDEIVADSPTKDEYGNWRPGAEIDCAFMQVTGIIEDGIIASETACDILTMRCVESRSGTIGRRRFPLNLSGTRTEYKPVPDLGETIRSDGLLFAMRDYDPLMAAVNMAEDQLCVPDYVFDTLTYAHPGARVIDIEARMGEPVESSHTPIGMESQPLKYHNKEVAYIDEILRIEREQLGRGSARKLGDKLHRLIRDGLIFKNSERKRVRQMYNMRPLEDWRINVTFEYDLRPGVGSKLTDAHGAKGVICSRRPDSEMPVDQFGRIAHLVFDGNSTIKRMNPGRFYEHYFNAHGDQLQREIIALRDEMGTSTAFYEKAFEMACDFYMLINPTMVDRLKSPRYKGSKRHHVNDIIKNSVTYHLPTVNAFNCETIARNLMREHPLVRGPVTLTAPDGSKVLTNDSVIISSLYILNLEKSGDDRSAVSSARLNHFGLPGKVNQANKYSSLIRESAIRPMGTAEVRNLVAFAGGDTTAELIEASMNPALHKHTIDNLVASATPTGMESVVSDLSLVGVGGRNLDHFHSAIEASGIALYRTDAHLDDGIIYPPREGDNAL